MELSNTCSKPVLNNRHLEEVSQQNTIIHVLVRFHEILVKKVTGITKKGIKSYY